MAHIQKRTYKSRRNGKSVTSWQARYSAPDGKERTRRFNRQIDAQKWLDVHGADIARGEWVDPVAAQIPFREWAELWKKTLTDLRPSTLAWDLDYLKRYIMPTFGDQSLGDIDHMGVQQWVSGLTSTGPSPWWDVAEDPKRKSKPVAPATAVKAAQIMGKIMAAAVAAGKFKVNPCIGVRLPKIEHREMHFLDPDEIETLTRSMTPRYRALVLVAAYGGLRIGELAGLRRGRVNIPKGSIDVAEIVVEVEGKLTHGPPKTRAGLRSVTLPRYVVQALDDHMAEFTSAGPDAFVFSAPEGGPIRVPKWRQRYWNPAVCKAGIGPLTPHSLRHTAVALWIVTGANQLEVARRAGHTSVSFTLDRYGHLFPDADAGVADRLDALITSTEKSRIEAENADTGSISDGRMTDNVSEDDAEILPFTTPDQGSSKWALRDSNPRPQPCEGCALTS